MYNFIDTIKKDFKSDSNLTEIEKIIFNVILMHIKDLVFLMKVENNRKFTYLFVNEEGKIHAKLADDYVGRELHMVMPKETADHLEKQYSVVVEKKLVYSFHDKVKIDKNTYVVGESVLTPILNDNNEVLYIISVTRDITERMQEKRKLIESQQRYKSIVDHNMDAVFSLDLDGRILSVNPTAFEIVKNKEHRIFELTIFDLFVQEDLQSIRSLFQKSVHGQPADGEAILCMKNNRELHLQFKTIPIIINACVEGMFLIGRDITEQARQEAVIKHMAYHDALTGLNNRSALKKDLKENLHFAKENNQPLTLMYIDLDRFKMLNDSLGHNIGDLLLMEVGKRLRQLNHPDYNVYRQGGDEFIILFINTARELAEDMARSILQLFKDPFHLNELIYFISPSIGISIYPNDSSEEEGLITKADTALYVVKQRGRGHFQLYCEEMDKNSNDLLVIETGLRRAVENNELNLFYQPQIDLSSSKTVSFEALLRWNHPTLGAVSPVRFIPVAEESGLIIPIGEWVIEEACKQIYMWNQKGYKDLIVAINLSAKQFQQPHLVEMIESLFETYEIDPNQIEFEITEGALQNAEEALAMIKRLKCLGVSISVDDFGTGFSSLMYLKQFPIDTLKIDQSFIRDVLTDQKDAAITTTILHLAHNLGLSVVAEGIETKEQLEFLTKMNCQKGQGYYFSKPVSHSEIEENYFM
ncbi:EAL domain-containing protein [Metabacillus herbersteinensis]|uniref:EAL domain-containing protein n=1 Tax=Metabacillus herbersteinensis TaxID=283816 RepID=A0ABV6GAK6_9BACI